MTFEIKTGEVTFVSRDGSTTTYNIKLDMIIDGAERTFEFDNQTAQQNTYITLLYSQTTDTFSIVANPSSTEYAGQNGLWSKVVGFAVFPASSIVNGTFFFWNLLPSSGSSEPTSDFKVPPHHCKPDPRFDDWGNDYFHPGVPPTGRLPTPTVKGN